MTSKLIACFHSMLLVLLLLLTACGDKNRLTPLAANAVILAFGDSLTKGRGVTEPESYPAVLGRLTGRRVINAGVSGELTETGLSRIRQVLTVAEPALLLLMHGGNDILQSRSSAAAKENLKRMIEIAKTMNVQVVLIGIPERSPFSSSAPIYKSLAREFDLVFEDSIIASLLKKPTMKSDAVHFNKAGYQAIAETLDKLLRENGAL